MRRRTLLDTYGVPAIVEPIGAGRIPVSLSMLHRLDAERYAIHAERIARSRARRRHWIAVVLLIAAAAGIVVLMWRW